MEGNQHNSSDSCPRYSINFDQVGMEAIMGSLYKKEGNNECPTTTRLHEPTRKMAETPPPPTEKSSDSAHQSAANRPVYPRGSRRRATVDSIGCKVDINRKVSARKVSFSDDHLVSLIDMKKSPDTFSNLNTEWAQLLPSFPHPSEGGKPSSSSCVDSPFNDLLASHGQHSPMRRQQHAHLNPQDNQQPSNPQDIHQQNRKPATRVIYLPWTGQGGIDGEYSGEVNSAIQPHGTGIFTVNGDAAGVSCTWRNGVMVCISEDLMEDTSDALGQGSSRCISEPVSSMVEDCPTSTIKPTASTTSIPGYHLGLPAKHRSHMQIAPTSQIAIMNAASLKSLDFAFVLRGSGVWTYSIVAGEPTINGEASIRFVLDSKGSTKFIRKRNWEKGIRLVNTELVNADGSINIVDSQQKTNLGQDISKETDEHRTRQSRRTSTGTPSREINLMCSKFNRRSSDQQAYMSFTSINAVSTPIEGNASKPDKRKDDNRTIETNQRRARNKNADKIDTHAISPAVDIDTLLSSDYQCILDDHSTQVEHEIDHRRASFHIKSSTRHRNGDERKSKSRSNKSQLNDLYLKSNSFSVDDQHMKGVTIKSSSFHSVAYGSNEKRITSKRDNSRSHGELTGVSSSGDDKNMKRRGSTSGNDSNCGITPGGNVSSFNLRKNLSSDSLATADPTFAVTGWAQENI